MNFTKLFRHFLRIYGRNNSIYITSLSDRVTMLLCITQKLQDCIRKKRDQETLGKALANCFSWTMAVAGHFQELPLSKALCIKYPKGGCGYCGKKPCICKTHARKKHKSKRPLPEQLRWSLRDHQQNLDALYGDINREHGIQNILNRLFAEIGEISLLIGGMDHIGSLAEVIESEYAKEIADVVAWIIAVAIFFKIDLETEVLSLYGKGCPSCKRKPCRCPKFVFYEGRIQHFMTTPGVGSTIVT